MLGRIYTFQRERTADDGGVASVSTRALDAIVEASGAQSGIRFEALTEDDNPRPVVAILFDRLSGISRFDRQLETLLARQGITVSVMRTSIGRAENRAGETPRDAGFRAA